MNDTIRGRQCVINLTNKTGGQVVAGDVVIISSADAAAFISTTSAAQSADIVGVVLETIASNAVGRVCFLGEVPIVTLTGSASLGDYLFTSAVAKQAQRSSTTGVGAFGQVLGTGTTPRAYLWGQPTPVSGAAGDVATDPIWDAKGDLVAGVAGNTAQRLPVGADGKVLIAASGETTGLKWDAIPSTYGAIISRAATQSVTTSAVITFDTETRDDNSFWTVGDPTKITIPVTGWYMVTLGVEFSSGATVRYVALRVDGATKLPGEVGPVSTASVKMQTGLAYYFTAGQYLEVLITATNDVLKTYLSIVRIMS